MVVDPDELARLPAAVRDVPGRARARRRRPAGAIAHAEHASTLAVDGDDLASAAAPALAGLASWSSGDIASAHASYAAAIPA